MAVTADPDELAATVAALYREAESTLVRRIARQLAAGVDAPGWAVAKLGAVRDVQAAARLVLAGLDADAGPRIRQAVARAYRSGTGSALAELAESFAPSSGIGAAARAARGQLPGMAAMEALADAVVRETRAVHSAILRRVPDVYRDVITGAVARTTTGGQTRRQAAQSAWQALTDRGITSFRDKAGRRWQLASYVEMATRTVTARAAVQGHVDALDAAGQRLVWVSDHAQECALCRPWEGRVLALSGPTGTVQVEHATRDGEAVTVQVAGTLDQARAAGLLHPNCRHTVSLYLPGVTRLPTATADPTGDRARTRQRAIERQIRKWKTRQAGALDDDARRDAGRKVRAWQAAMREHVAEHDLKRLPYRERIGAGNIPDRGRTDDAARGIGPDRQLTLDGAPAGRPPARPVVDQVAEAAAHDENAARDRAPGPGQGELDLRPDPLDGVDLSTRSDDQLAELLAEHIDDDRAVSRVTAEFDRRDAQRAAAEQAPPAPADPLAGLDLSTLPDDRLADLLTEHADDPAVFDRISAEFDRRDQANADGAPAVDESQADEVTDEERRIDELVARGWDYREAYAEVHDLDPEALRREELAAALDAQRFPGESRDDAVRRLYAEEQARRYVEAENYCRGHMLTREGEAADIDPVELFGGPIARARKYASEELLQWWADNGRTTLVEYRAELLGRESDVRQAEKGRHRSNGQDFI